MKTERLLSLDVLRGLTVAAMIMMNDMGSGDYIYTPLEHSAWEGLTPTDLIFPFFMFVMGMSMAFSLGQSPLKYPKLFWKKLLRRTLLLFAFGLFLSWFGLICKSSMIESFTHLRIPGVLQRLAVSYFLATLLVAFIPRIKTLVWITGGILLVYWGILIAGHGFELTEHNIIGIVDRAVFGSAHIYQKSHLADGTPIAFDPEGLLSTLPCISHVLIGYFCGRTVKSLLSLDEKWIRLTVTGISLLFAGYLISYGCPIIKRSWTPSYVLVTSGYAYLLLIWLIWLIDLKKKRGWIVPFQAFGMNPLVIYMAASFFSIVLNITEIKLSAFEFFNNLLGFPKVASLLYGMLYATIFGLVACFLYKRRFFIKL